MNKTALLLSISLLAFGGYACNSQPAEKTQAQSAKTAPDNTGRNVQDRSGATLTAGAPASIQQNIFFLSFRVNRFSPAGGILRSSIVELLSTPLLARENALA